MEVAEATNLEAAIVWRAQTILETLQLGELDAWIHRVGLAGATGELKSEVERMETVVNGVNGRAVGNKPLARSLARVKELMYKADDVVDELDYFRLQEDKVNGAIMIASAIGLDGMVGDGAEQLDATANTVAMLVPATGPKAMVADGAEHVDASASTAGIPDNSGRKNRSKERDYFHITLAVNGEPARAKCIDCGTQVVFSHGTSVLRKHRNSASCKKKRAGAVIEEVPNCSSAGDNVQNCAIILNNTDSECRKRMRTESNVATITHPLDRANFLKRIHKITLELGSIRDYVVEYLKDSVACFYQYQNNNISDTGLRTSGSRPGKVYGRFSERNRILSVIKAAKSDSITVLPIVGIVGVGKTALAKLVYNDLLIKNQFERIWVWVSNIFDEVRVTREILDVVILNSHEGSPHHNRESYEGVSNYTKLQEVLKAHMAGQPKRFLLVLDDVNDSMDDSRWKVLLDALGSSCMKGNVIIVTARNVSIAQRLGTVEPVKLGALKDDDFWRLFKACAFSDNNCEENNDIGRQIASKLHGNPLAAENAADMLREQPTHHHWKKIMMNGVWESMQFRGGIVTALKISYYQLPYNLQQCLFSCSIFPNGHLFHIDDLIYMWISLGFVKSVEVGHDYLNVLVNSGFLEHVETRDSIPHHQKYYVMCGIMHELARVVSRAEFATMDGLDCKEVLPTVRHVSILISSVYHLDEYGIICHNAKFEEKLKSIISSVRRLRTLILIGHYNSLFFQSFQTFMCSFVNCTHLRYLKLENKGSNETLPIFLNNFHHLEVLDVRQPVIVDGTSDLVNMRNFVLSKGICSLAWSVFLQTIHLEDCEGLETLPSLERLPSLTKLKLRSLPEVMDLLIPSLEELVLTDLPKLVRCLPYSMRDLNSSLRVLEIRRCQVLKSFPLFERCENFEIELKSWLPNVNEMIIHECPHLMVSNPLPPSSGFCKLSIRKVSSLPNMEGSSDQELRIGSLTPSELLVYSTRLILGDKILSFRNMRTITRLEIMGCLYLSPVPVKALRQLVWLKRLEIESCNNLFPLHVPPARAHEDMTAIDFDALPSLECLSIVKCEITGDWLSVMLQHVRALEELHLYKCEQVTGLSIEGKKNNLSNLTLAPCASSQRNPYRDGASTWPCPSKLLCIPSNLVPFLKKMSIKFCELKFQGNKEGFSGFTSLEELKIAEGHELISSLVHEGRWLLPSSLGVLDIYNASLVTLQPCFPGNLTRLAVLEVSEIFGLKSLQLHSCTALEKLTIEWCESLEALEGFQSLRSLRYLKVYGCPVLPQCLESLSTQGYELCPQLERLRIDDPSFLTTPFCKHLTSLQFLQLEHDYEEGIVVAGLTWEQEAALQLLMSLQQLTFYKRSELSDLPVGLHSLPSLKRLEIFECPNITRLPERGLPSSLEELEVLGCSEKLSEQCRKVATSKLKVIIDGEYVN